MSSSIHVVYKTIDLGLRNKCWSKKNNSSFTLNSHIYQTVLGNLVKMDA